MLIVSAALVGEWLPGLLPTALAFLKLFSPEKEQDNKGG